MNIFSTNKLFSILTALAVMAGMFMLLFPASAFAQGFNSEINYQGKLNDSAGSTVADGDYDITFRLYDASSGGTKVWEGVRAASGGDGPAVSVSSGLFSVRLGRYDSLNSVDFNQDLWLSVEVESDGEMTPRKKLTSVPSAIEAENAQTVGGVASSSLFRSDQADTQQASSSATLMQVIQDGVGDVAKFVQNNTVALFVDDDGDTGVGTTTTPAQLTVQGDGTDDIQSWFNESGDQVAVVDDQGNVGIGTDSPGEKLQVSGNLLLDDGGGNAGLLRQDVTGVELPSRKTDWVSNQWNGAIYQTKNSGKPHPFDGWGHLVIQPRSSKAKDIVLATGTATPTPAMVLDAAGRVSIGTSNPSGILDINGNSSFKSNGDLGLFTTSPDTRFHIEPSDTGAVINAPNTIAAFERDGNAHVSIIGNNSDTSVLNFGDGDNVNIGKVEYDHSDDSLQFDTNTSERMRIDSAGNVGLGTDSPVDMLHLQDNGQVGQRIESTDDEKAQIRLRSGSSDTWIYHDNVSSDAGLTVDTENVEKAFHIQESDGNVGIATTTPAQELTVAGTIQSADLYGGASDISVDANGNIVRGSASDEKFKTNVNQISSPLATVRDLRGVAFDWKHGTRFGTGSGIGFVAQEVEDTLPELVGSGGDYKTMAYDNLTALNVEAIKALDNKIAGLATSTADTSESETETKKTLEAGEEICLDGTCIGRKAFKEMVKDYKDQTNASVSGDGLTDDADSDREAADGGAEEGKEESAGDTESNQEDNTASSSTASTTDSQKQDGDNNQEGQKDGDNDGDTKEANQGDSQPNESKNSDEQPNKESEEAEQDADEDEPKNDNIEDNEKKESDEGDDLVTADESDESDSTSNGAGDSSDSGSIDSDSESDEETEDNESDTEDDESGGGDNNRDS